MSQLLDSLKGYITPALISKAASMLGEDNSAISKGIKVLLPSLLGGMASKAGDKGVINDIFKLIKNNGDSNVLTNLTGLLGGDTGKSAITSSLLSMLFGNKTNGIISNLASFAGLKRGSVQSLIGMVSPMIIGYLSRMIGDKKINKNEFATMLDDQKNHIISDVPSSLRASMGLVPEEEPKKKRGFGWIWAILGLAAVAFLAMSLMKGCGEEAGNKSIVSPVDGITDVVDDATDAVKDGVDAAKEGVAGLGDFFKRKLANGVELDIPENGVENQLVEFVEDDTKEIDKTTWFNFDRLTFEKGKSTLDMEKSGEQLKNIAAIMAAYPKSKVKIGGYTDNTGSKEVNKRISKERAAAVKAALVDLKVTADRMEIEGYGVEHPIASNDTKEGRAQNRRIALRFTEK